MTGVPTASLTKVLSVQQLQRRFDRLRSLQRRLPVPASAHLVACGRLHKLPLRAKTAQWQGQIPARILEYLAGLFDGDGCVAAAKKGKFQLSLSQSNPQSGGLALLLFRNVFGGGIYRHGRQTGMVRPAMQWGIFGNPAQTAAAALSQASSCKRDRLLVAGGCTSTAQHGQLCFKDVTMLQNNNPNPKAGAECRSWAYLAGFFDAEGTICMRYPARLSLKITQNDPQILLAIKSFLASEGFASSIYADRHAHDLVVGRTAESKDVLENLLRGGLRVKREAARIALQLTRDSFHHVRSRMSECIGYQSRYMRLSDAGTQRAYEIACLYARLRSKFGSGSAIPREQQLQLAKLRTAHQLQCMEDRYRLLRKDIRLQLSKGS